MAEENDKYLGRSLRELGEFGEPQLELFRKIVTKESIVCDVGANVGALTVPLARMASCVHAFEPQRHVYHMLCGNVALNDLHNVSCYHMALGERREVLDVVTLDYSHPDNNLGAFSLEMPGEKADRVLVAPLVIPCHFLKIDVEGYEAQVLRGAAPMIAECRPTIYVENDRRAKSDALIALLRTMGYTPYWHITPLFNPANFNAMASSERFGELLSIDMLCTPEPIDTNFPEAVEGDHERLGIQMEGEQLVAA